MHKEDQRNSVTSFVYTLKELQEDYSLYLQASTDNAELLQEAQQDSGKRMNLFSSTIISTIERVYLNNVKHMDTYQRRGVHQRLDMALKEFYSQSNDYSYRSKPLSNYTTQSGFFKLHKAVVNLSESWGNAGVERKQKFELAANNLEMVINSIIDSFSEKKVDDLHTSRNVGSSQRL